MIALLTVNRSGEFTIKSCTDGPQCGSMASRHYKYLVSLTGYSDELDEFGFVIDNALIDDYFVLKYSGREMAAVSCENMAVAAIEYFKKKPTIRKIKVTIHGSERSFIEGFWEG